jgi:hypothetical protein
VALAWPRRERWAAWLGIAALALYAVVPVHLAFDLAAALAARPGELPAIEHAGHHHHHHHDGGAPHQHPADHGKACQFCAAAVSLAGFATSAGVVLPVPLPIAAQASRAASIRFALKDAPTAYRSRAPPLA